MTEHAFPQQPADINDDIRQVALESVDTGTWLYEPGKDHVRTDKYCRELIGFGPEDTLPIAELWERIYPADQLPVQQYINKVLSAEGNTRFVYEFRMLRNGAPAPRRIQVRGKVTRVPGGPPRRIAGTILDVTDDYHPGASAPLLTDAYPAAAPSQAPVGIMVTHPDGRLVQGNKALETLLGYSADELSGNVYARIVQPEGQQDFLEQINRLSVAGPASLNRSVRCVRKDGQPIWVNWQITAVELDSGGERCLFSLLQNVLEDVALRDEQQKLSTLVGSSLSFMGTASLDGRLTYLNKAGRELVGLTEHESLDGLMAADLYAPEQAAWFKETVVPTLLREGYWSGRIKIKNLRTGELIPCYANGIRIDDPLTGRPIGRGFMIRDLRPELAAGEAQRKLLTLVDNSVELMSILEMDGHNSYINKAGMHMLGFDNEEQVREIPVSELHHPDHLVKVEQEVLPAVMQTGRWSGEMLVRHLKTGEVFPVFNNAIRIDDPETGEPIAVGAVMRDRRPELAVQQALQESETRFRSMIMQAPVAICLLRGGDMVIESANDSMHYFWGRGPEIIGQTLLEAFPDAGQQQFLELLQGVYRSGNPFYGYEVLAVLERNGRMEEGYYNFVYAPIRENGTDVNGIIIVATEVTAQVQAKKELEESEKRFRGLVLDAPIATAVYWGPDMVIQLANEAMLTLWGKDESVIGKPLREALPELAGQPFHELLEEVYRTGTIYQGNEDRADLMIDGRLQSFYFNFTYKPLYDAAGNVYAILNMAVDITHQVNARQQLKETEENLREAIDLAELAPWVSDMATGDIVGSERINKWLGIDGPLTGEAVANAIHPKDRAHVDLVVQEASMNPERGGRFDLEYSVINAKTGEELVLRTQARVLFTEEGIPYGVRGTSQDITVQRMTEQALEKQVELRTEELRRSNVQLQRSNQELERYAYVASHDLQEPLRKIQLYSGLLAEQFKDNTTNDTYHYLSRIQVSANRVSTLIKNILDFSRINYESQVAPAVNLDQVVAEVLNDLDLVLNQTNGRVHVNALGTIPAVPIQMTQLFYNLIGNSLKFVREEVGPVITLSRRELTAAEVSGYEKLNAQLPYCEITVSDNGIGFDPAFAQKIFGLFQRLHHQESYKGTGIGLALCQRIVYNHNGEIWADAQEGAGATFHLILPAGGA